MCPGEIEIRPGSRLKLPFCFSGEPRLRQAQAAHFSAHVRSIAYVEVEQAPQLGIAASTHVGVYKCPGQVRSTVVFKIHGQKSDFGSHVGAAEAWRKLETVEQDDASTVDANACGVQIAVAIADAPIGDSARQQRLLIVQHAGDRRLDFSVDLSLNGAANQCFYLGEVLGPIGAHHRRTAVLVDARAGRCSTVEACQQPGDALDERYVDLTPGQERGQHATGREPPHVDRGLATAAGSTNDKSPITFYDLHEAQVDVGRETAVQADLVGAILSATLACGEVQKTQIHGLLQFVDMLAR